MKAALEEFTGRTCDVALGAYAMHRCPACTLEFADPPAPAGAAFYEWLDRNGTYYLPQRWEWDVVAARLARDARPARVLEIGAGDGRFLNRLRSEAGAEVTAVEHSERAVARLRNAGIEAFAERDASAALGGRTFDYVLAFHCLEHVPDPVGFARMLRARAGTDGAVLFSVPYSPMYFEAGWFDPLNHPPHHLTRWNRASLEALARSAGEKAELRLPMPLPLLKRVRYALAIAQLGPHWARRRWRWRLLPLLHPLRAARELARQARRDHIAGRAAADVVLVELAPAQPGRRATST